MEQQRLINEDQVALLQVVSEPLRMEVHFELFFPMLSAHPFFTRYMEMCPHVMRRICHSACAMQQCSPGDVMFNAGEKPQDPKMYFVSVGNLEYHDEIDNEDEVSQGQWLSE